MTFTFKKLEKITAALYLVSGLLKDNEPLKWEMREKAISLLSVSITLNSTEPVDKNNAIQALFTVTFETISLLNISILSGLISDMNYRILKHEIEEVVNLIRRKVTDETVGAGYILSDSFFRTDFKTDSPEDTKDYKGHFEGPSQTGVKEAGGSRQAREAGDAAQKFGQKYTQKSAQNSHRKAYSEKGIVKDKKNNRQEIIIDLLQKKSNLTIKDFAGVISGCSEKTIQRELLYLVEKGLIRKEGERRWSRYSLVK